MPEKFLSEDDVALLRKHDSYKDLSEEHFQRFLYGIERHRLDPFANQIYAIQRWDNKAKIHKLTIQTGIDGYRVLADRSGKCAGNDDAVFDAEQNPQRATVTVWKMIEGTRYAFTATARWDEYYPGDKAGMMWQKMKHVMLAKCAEALALRKAFPAELSGLYTSEEMAQADSRVENGGSGPKQQTPPPRKQPPAETTGTETSDRLLAIVAQMKAFEEEAEYVPTIDLLLENLIWIAKELRAKPRVTNLQLIIGHIKTVTSGGECPLDVVDRAAHQVAKLGSSVAGKSQDETLLGVMRDGVQHFLTTLSPEPSEDVLAKLNEAYNTLAGTTKPGE